MRTGNKDAVSDNLSAGYDTARVSAGEAEARRQRELAALRYLNGRFPPAEAAELADILGLNPDTRPAGYCSCGVVLPMSTATSSPSTRPGMCAKCTTAAAPPRPEPVRVMTAQCAVCHRTYGVTGAGRIRSHQGWDHHRRLATLCEGSQRQPERGVRILTSAGGYEWRCALCPARGEASTVEGALTGAEEHYARCHGEDG